MVEIQAFGGSPGMFFTTLVQLRPPSRVTCTLPSSLPAQMTFASRTDGAMVSSVLWNSAAVLSVTMSPPDDFCLFLSLVVRSGEITSHDWPKFEERNTTLPPK